MTSGDPHEAMNFGLDEHVEHETRYRRAHEFFDVVTGLWDHWADDAFIRDVENGVFFDPERMHVLDHKGPFLSVRGPLNSRPANPRLACHRAGRRVGGGPPDRGRDAAEVIFEGGNNLRTRSNSMPM